MVAFLVLAAVLTLAGVALVAIPLLRNGNDVPAPDSWAALGAGTLLIIGSALLYALWSNWPWRASTPGNSPQTMVAHLARQLEQDPNNLQGWLMLGRSYVVLQEYPLALRAYERAERLSGGKSVEALTGEAEALALSDESELDGRAGKLIERALALDPNSGKALFFGAALAERRGELALARQRFATLLAMNPPPSVRPLLEQQLSALDERLTGTGAGEAQGAATPAAGAVGGAAQPPAAGDAGPLVRVNVSLAPSITASATAPLFVFVRDPAQPGPPLAVKRLESRFPQSVSLGASDSMIAGRGFSPGQNVQVVARIARSGNPVGASGDPFGEVTYKVGQDGLVSLVIDHVTP